VSPRLADLRRRGSGGVKPARVAALVVLAIAIPAWLTLRSASRPAGAPSPAGLTTPAGVAEPVPERSDTLLEARLRRLVEAMPARCGIVARHLGNGTVARVNADTLVPLMSVVKLPVAMVVLDGVDRGRWPLDTSITLLARDMHPRGWLGDRYPRGGGPVALRRLLEEMLTRSDNSSADALMRLVGGPRAVTGWLEQRGIRDFRVDRTERGLGNDWYGVPAGGDTMGSAEEIREIRHRLSDAVHDSAAAAMRIDPRDTGSAEACVRLLARLWRGDLLSAAMTDTLKAMLGRCRTAPRRLPALLPRGTPVARKTGTGGTWRGVTVAINDVGVMRLPNGDEVAIAVLVGSPRGPVPRAERLIARAARAVYDAWSVDSSGQVR
jgi:beta-lactamase class A